MNVWLIWSIISGGACAGSAAAVQTLIMFGVLK